MNLKEKIKIHQENYDQRNCIKSWHERNDPDYEAVVAIGEPAIPVLIEMLGESWFPIITLLAIIGESPIAKEHAGMFDHINDDLRAWASKNGYAKETY